LFGVTINDKISNMKKKYMLLTAILIFFGFNLIFNNQNWRELFAKKTSYNTIIGDSLLTEFMLESNYQQIKEGKNPFIFKKKLFYPFTINISLNDPGTSNVMFFFLLRPFLGVHESMLLVVLINIFLANLLMYLLLTKLKINHWLSIVLALSYGFIPIVAFRALGHYTYTSIYVFPLIFLIVLKFLEEKIIKKKILVSILFGFFMMFVLLLNFYYFIGIVLGIASYFIYYLMTNKKTIIKFIFKNTLFLLTSLFSFLIFISPWLYSVYKLITSVGIEKTRTFGGAVELSGDLFGFLTPSEYNPIYHFILQKIGTVLPIFSKYYKFYTSNTEKFIYPGLIIVSIYISLFLFKKNIPQKLWHTIKPHLIISLIFASLLLGPFLKIFNRWMINLDGVGVVLPLPFLLLHYFPGLSSLRAPTRFTPVFVFLALIVAAYIIDYFFKHINKKHRAIFIICLFVILVIDQFALLPKGRYSYFPLKIYNHLKTIQDPGTVLEIPFTVRDGFQYIGFVHAIGPMNGRLIHNKPIIGGYFARVPQRIFDFYKNKKFIDYVASIIDKGNYDPGKEKPKEPNIYSFPYSITTIEEDLISLNVKFIILKNDEKYTDTIGDIIVSAGFLKQMSENNYDLYIKE